MTIDVNEIILNKIKELDEQKIIEKAIEAKIESVITSTVNNAFDYDFSRKLSEIIRNQVGNIAASIKLNSYNSLVSETVKNILEAEMNADLANKVQAKVRELLLVTEKSVKLSDIVKKYKEVNFYDDEEYKYSVTKEERTSGGFYIIKYDFISDNNEADENWSIEFLSFKNKKDWAISQVKYAGETIFNHTRLSMLKSYDLFECLIWRCVLNNLPVELDYDESQCEDELYQSNDC